MKQWMKDTLWLFVRLFLPFMCVVALMAFFIWIFENNYINVVDSTTPKKIEFAAEHFNAAALIILTVFIFCAGWIQLKDLNKTSKGDFLFRIDERYGQSEIIKARKIIHEYYCLTQFEDIDPTIHVQKIAQLVYDTKLHIEKADNFICLLNFLDFLETIAYFTNQGFISIRDIDELTGCSLKYYYCIFQKLIISRRIKYNSDNFYCELEKLALIIQDKNPNIPPFIK